jgi:hypothetical protein
MHCVCSHLCAPTHAHNRIIQHFPTPDTSHWLQNVDVRCLCAAHVWTKTYRWIVTKNVSISYCRSVPRYCIYSWYFIYCIYFNILHIKLGHAVAQLVSALRYKPEGRGFYSRGTFHWHNPSGRTMTLGSTQPLTEMSTRNISWGQRQQVRRANKLTTFMCRLSWNLGASTSGNRQGLSRTVQELPYFYIIIRYSNDRTNVSLRIVIYGWHV